MQKRISLSSQKIELQLLQKYIEDLLLDINGLNMSLKMQYINRIIDLIVRRLVLVRSLMLKRSPKS